jgi:hypothetical protein
MEDLRLEVDERAVEGSSGSLVEVFLFVLFALVFVTDPFRAVHNSIIRISPCFLLD